MTRISIGGGRWFDQDKARYFSDNAGRNATWKERMFFTASGTWVLNGWSRYVGVAESYTITTPEEAAKWLIDHGHELPEELAEWYERLEV